MRLISADSQFVHYSIKVRSKLTKSFIHLFQPAKTGMNKAFRRLDPSVVMKTVVKLQNYFENVVQMRSDSFTGCV